MARSIWHSKTFRTRRAGSKKSNRFGCEARTGHPFVGAAFYTSTNRTEQAIETLNAYVASNKTTPALMTLAGIHERLKQFDKSRDAYEQLLKVSPDFAPALNNLAVLYSEYLGQNDRALEFAQKAKDLTPNEPHAADTLGSILFKKADYLNALRQLQESAAKLADDPEVQFHLGMARYMMGPGRTSPRSPAEGRQFG